MHDTRNLHHAARCLGMLLIASGLWASAHAATQWTLPTGYPDSNFHTQNIKEFAADVARRTAGELAIAIAPNGELMKAPEIKSAVATGKVAVGEVIMSSLAQEMPIMGADSVPFLARGYDEARRLWVATRPRVEQALADRGMTLLFAVPWPPQGLFAAKGIAEPGDFRNTVQRTYNPATEQLARQLGAIPQAVAAADLAAALTDKRVQSFVSSAATGLDVRAYEHLATFFDIQAWLPKNVVIANTKALNTLAPKVKQELIASAREAEARGWRLSEQRSREWTDALAARGMRVAKPSFAMQQELNRIGETMVRRWIRESPKADAWIVVQYEIDKSRHANEKK